MSSGSIRSAARRRFTFGPFAFENGFQLIPVLIGLFAMSEVLLQAFDHDPLVCGAEAPPFKRSAAGFAALWRMQVTLLLSSIVETLVGILPGIGSTVPAFKSDTLARSGSADAEQVGKGAPEAVTGGALVPTLARGIPGGAVTAVTPGAVMLHGLAPGPFLFRDHGLAVHAIFEALLLPSIPTVSLGALFFRIAFHVTRIQPRRLLPAITILAIPGAFSVNDSLFDAWGMLGAGVLGVLFQRSTFPRRRC